VQALLLNANKRNAVGRSSANELRRQERVPGIFYTHDHQNIAIEVKALDLRPLVYTAETHIVDLRIGSEEVRKCILKDVQFDPVTDKVVHFDLMGIAMTDKIRMEVPIVLNGVAAGVRQGGLLNHMLHKVEIECLASDLPEHIDIDIEKLGLGDVLTVGDIPAVNFQINADPEVPVVTVSHARAAEEAVEPVAEEQPAEPEVISRGKAADEEQG